MNRYTFRVDIIPDVDIDIIKKRVEQALESSESEKYLISLEEAKKTKKLHYQGVIYSSLKFMTYKKRMEGIFPEWKGTRGCKGQGKRSFAEVKGDSYEIYITKDDNIKYVKGYTDEEIQLLKSQSYHKSEDKSKENWFLTLVQHCYDNNVDAMSDGWQIGACIIDAYQKYIKCEPNDFQIKSYAKSIQRHMVAQYAEEVKKPHVWSRYKELRAKEIIGHEWVRTCEFMD